MAGNLELEDRKTESSGGGAGEVTDLPGEMKK